MANSTDVLEIIRSAEKQGISYFGLRQHHEPVKVGCKLAVSYDQIDDQEDEELNGTCASQISYDGFDLEDFDFDCEHVIDQGYQEGPLILIGGKTQDFGNDDHEIIISDAVVLAVIKS